MAALPRLRHLRRGKHSRVRHRGKILTWLAELFDVLGDPATGTAQNFTTDVQVAVGVLTAVGNAVADEVLTIGTTDYTFKANIEAQAAVGTLTAIDNPDDNDTVTIGVKVYRFKGTIAQINDVLIGASASDSLDNLIAAVTAGAGAGTLYFTGTTANADATAVAGGGDTVTVTALVAGTAGNSIATTATGGDVDFAAATLLGGEAAEAAYSVEIGVSASATLDNLIAAINGAAGAGTLYGTGTVAHPDVSAAAGAGDTVNITALVAGTAGNSIATVGEGDLSFATATLEGGVTSNNLQATAHGYATGDGPFLVTTSGTRPTGLLASTLYWLKLRVDADNFTVTGKRAGGVTGISSDGSGTHTLTPASSEEAIFEQLKRHPREVVNEATDIDDLAIS